MGDAQDAMDKRMQAALADSRTQEQGDGLKQSGVKQQDPEQNKQANQDLKTVEMKTPDPVKDDKDMS